VIEYVEIVTHSGHDNLIRMTKYTTNTDVLCILVHFIIRLALSENNTVYKSNMCERVYA